MYGLNVGRPGSKTPFGVRTLGMHFEPGYGLNGSRPGSKWDWMRRFIRRDCSAAVSWEGRAVDRPRDPDTTRATLDKRQRDVAAMFDRVAARYDVANDILSLGQDRAWRRLVLEAVDPQSGEMILDVAAGTGTSTVPFVEAGAFVVATDLSLGMLTVGRQRQPQLTFVAGDALRLPFR